jgi:hypothetical protein
LSIPLSQLQGDDGRSIERWMTANSLHETELYFLAMIAEMGVACLLKMEDDVDNRLPS